MTVLSEMEPPPAYTPQATAQLRDSPTLSTLPDQLLLQILSNLSLIDLHRSARRTSRRLYIHSTHLLREWLLPSWVANLRGGWGSDPLALEAPQPTLPASSSAHPTDDRLSDNVFRFRTNDSATFDLFIATCAVELTSATASSLLDRPSFTPSTAHDLFAFLQPRARVADLLLAQGARSGLIAPIDRQRPRAGASASPWEGGRGGVEGEPVVWGEDVGVQLGTRCLKVLLPRKGGVMRAVVEVERRGRAEGEVEELVWDAIEGLRRAGLRRCGGTSEEGRWYEVAR